MNSNINRLKILTQRDLNFISSQKLQELKNQGYTIQGEGCSSCNQDRQDIYYSGRQPIQNLATTCNVTKKYVGAPNQTTGDTIPGIVRLYTAPTSTTPGGFTNVYFQKDLVNIPGAGPYSIVQGGSQSYDYVPVLADVRTTTHNFTTVMTDSCIGATPYTDPGCNLYIVDLGVMTPSTTNITIGAGQSANVTFSYMDTGSPTVTAYPSPNTYLTMLAPSINPATYVSVTNLTATGATINMALGAPAGTTATVTFTARVGSAGTQKTANITVQSCSNPVCNFSVT